MICLADTLVGHSAGFIVSPTYDRIYLAEYLVSRIQSRIFLCQSRSITQYRRVILGLWEVRVKQRIFYWDNAPLLCMICESPQMIDE